MINLVIIIIIEVFELLSGNLNFERGIIDRGKSQKSGISAVIGLSGLNRKQDSFSIRTYCLLIYLPPYYKLTLRLPQI